MASASLKMQMSSGGSCSLLVGMDGMGMGQLHWGISSLQALLRGAGAPHSKVGPRGEGAGALPPWVMGPGLGSCVALAAVSGLWAVAGLC